MQVCVEPAQAPLRGSLTVPGDKSISHRAALLAALAVGVSRITGFNPGEDTQSTLECLRLLGATIQGEDNTLFVEGPSRLQEPGTILDAGNSGTTIRMLTGILAASDFFSVITGDPSLRRRPMGRIVGPLTEMGAEIRGRKGDQLAPLAIRGRPLHGRHHRLVVASAQVKSALLFAGMLARGTTRISEPYPSRDHTERLFAHAGLELGARRDGVEVRGEQRPRPFTLRVSGDISGAAFFVTAACILAGSNLKVEGVGLNPTRLGFLRVLRRMGAQINTEIVKEAPEPWGDIVVQGSTLLGTDIDQAEVPSLIDELPVLAVAASVAQGRTRMKGVGELRHKESDRLANTCALINSMGGQAEISGDDLVITGGPLRGTCIQARGDHRMAMTAAVAGLVATGPTTISGCECVNISYPAFFDEFRRLGAIFHD